MRDYITNGGVEKWWGSAPSGEFAARGALGVGNQAFRQVSSGFGYRWKYLSLDYAFVFNLTGIEIGSTSGTHRFSLAYRFGPKKGEIVNLAKSLYPDVVDDLSLSVLKNPEESVA